MGGHPNVDDKHSDLKDPIHGLSCYRLDGGTSSIEKDDDDSIIIISQTTKREYNVCTSSKSSKDNFDVISVLTDVSYLLEDGEEEEEEKPQKQQAQSGSHSNDETKIINENHRNETSLFFGLPYHEVDNVSCRLRGVTSDCTTSRKRLHSTEASVMKNNVTATTAANSDNIKDSTKASLLLTKSIQVRISETIQAASLHSVDSHNERKSSSLCIVNGVTTRCRSMQFGDTTSSKQKSSLQSLSITNVQNKTQSTPLRLSTPLASKDVATRRQKNNKTTEVVIVHTTVGAPSSIHPRQLRSQTWGSKSRCISRNTKRSHHKIRHAKKVVDACCFPVITNHRYNLRSSSSTAVPCTISQPRQSGTSVVLVSKKRSPRLNPNSRNKACAKKNGNFSIPTLQTVQICQRATGNRISGRVSGSLSEKMAATKNLYICSKKTVPLLPLVENVSQGTASGIQCVGSSCGRPVPPVLPMQFATVKAAGIEGLTSRSDQQSTICPSRSDDVTVNIASCTKKRKYCHRRSTNSSSHKTPGKAPITVKHRQCLGAEVSTEPHVNDGTRPVSAVITESKMHASSSYCMLDSEEHGSLSSSRRNDDTSIKIVSSKKQMNYILRSSVRSLVPLSTKEGPLSPEVNGLPRSDPLSYRQSKRRVELSTEHHKNVGTRPVPDVFMGSTKTVSASDGIHDRKVENKTCTRRSRGDGSIKILAITKKAKYLLRSSVRSSFPLAAKEVFLSPARNGATRSDTSQHQQFKAAALSTEHNKKVETGPVPIVHTVSKTAALASDGILDRDEQNTIPMNKIGDDDSGIIVSCTRKTKYLLRSSSRSLVPLTAKESTSLSIGKVKTPSSSARRRQGVEAALRTKHQTKVGTRLTPSLYTVSKTAALANGRILDCEEQNTISSTRTRSDDDSIRILFRTKENNLLRMSVHNLMPLAAKESSSPTRGVPTLSTSTKHLQSFGADRYNENIRKDETKICTERKRVSCAPAASADDDTDEDSIDIVAIRCVRKSTLPNCAAQIEEEEEGNLNNIIKSISSNNLESVACNVLNTSVPNQIEFCSSNIDTDDKDDVADLSSCCLSDQSSIRVIVTRRRIEPKLSSRLQQQQQQQRRTAGNRHRRTRSHRISTSP